MELISPVFRPITYDPASIFTNFDTMRPLSSAMLPMCILLFFASPMPRRQELADIHIMIFLYRHYHHRLGEQS